METIQTIKQRASVRKYQKKEIAKEILEAIVDAGHLAPTARAEEPWEFIVITETERKQKIANLTDYGKFIAEAAACIAVFCKKTKYYLEDGCAATENMLLAATDFGIGNCWVAGDKKPYTREIARILDVPEDYNLVSLVSLGYPQKEIVPHKKRPLSEVIHWESF